LDTAGAGAAVSKMEGQRVRRLAGRQPHGNEKRAPPLFQFDDVAADQAKTIRRGWRDQRGVVPRQLRQRLRDLLQPGVVRKAPVVNGRVGSEDDFEALAPAANYPVLIARGGGKQIVGLYGDAFVRLDGGAPEKIDVVNGKNSETVVLAVAQDLGPHRYTIRDCRGRTVGSGQTRLDKGARDFNVPVSGLLSLERVR